MANEKLKFMDMLSIMRVIDDDDRVRKFEDCIEKTFFGAYCISTPATGRVAEN